MPQLSILTFRERVFNVYKLRIISFFSKFAYLQILGQFYVLNLVDLKFK